MRDKHNKRETVIKTALLKGRRLSVESVKSITWGKTKWKCDIPPSFTLLFLVQKSEDDFDNNADTITITLNNYNYC